MTDISAEAQTLIDAGGFENEGGDGLFLRRVFDNQDQAVMDAETGGFRLSQTENRNFLAKPKQQEFETLEEALAEAEVWRQKVKVGTDPEMQKEWAAHLKRQEEKEGEDISSV